MFVWKNALNLKNEVYLYVIVHTGFRPSINIFCFFYRNRYHGHQVESDTRYYSSWLVLSQSNCLSFLNHWKRTTG